MGGEISCVLAGCSANSEILARDLALSGNLIERMPADVGRAIRVYGDVLSKEKLEQARDLILKELGRVDILVNAAGGNKPRATVSSGLIF